ncbi:MAG: flagellar hook capping FlgD N-terminal domain-containing protein [Leptospirales bacterium]
MANAISNTMHRANPDIPGNRPQVKTPEERLAEQVKVQEEKFVRETGKNKGDIIGNASSIMGKNEFLKLLVTQLSKQNPLDPVNDKEFIAQMAQFSALEQMQNVSAGMKQVTSEIKNFKEQNIKTMQNLESYSLLGKRVTAFDAKSQQVLTGEAKSVYRDKNGEIYVQIENNNGLHDVKFSHINKADIIDRVSRETIHETGTEGVRSKAAKAYLANQQMNSGKGEQTK